MNITIGPIEAFYIAGSIMVLALVIVVLPTLWENAQRRVLKAQKQK